MHFSIPFITRVEEVDVRLATETIPDVEISTNDGVVASFVDVQVILKYLLASKLKVVVPVPVLKVFRVPISLIGSPESLDLF